MGYIFTVVNMGLLRAVETLGLLRAIETIGLLWGVETMGLIRAVDTTEVPSACSAAGGGPSLPGLVPSEVLSVLYNLLSARLYALLGIVAEI